MRDHRAVPVDTEIRSLAAALGHRPPIPKHALATLRDAVAPADIARLHFGRTRDDGDTVAVIATTPEPRGHHRQPAKVLGAVAEHERSMIALRLRSSPKRGAKDGGYAYGTPLFGFRVDDGELVPDEGERETLDRARELREAGASIREIAATLNEEDRSTKRGARWHPTTVARVLGR